MVSSTNMKVLKSSILELKKCKKVGLFCLREDKNTIMEDSRRTLVEIVGQTMDNPYATFFKMLPDKDCSYILCGGTYETKEEGRVFIFWDTESACLKNKMVYTSSKDAVMEKLTGIKHEL